MPLIWKNGILEYWNIGNKSGNNLLKLSKNPSNPSFHYSIIPIGAKPISSKLMFETRIEHREEVAHETAKNTCC